MKIDPAAPVALVDRPARKWSVDYLRQCCVAGWARPGDPSGDRLPLVCVRRVPVPAEVITVAVRLYLRYGLSYRDVQELLAERGIRVDHVTVYRIR